MCVGYLTTHAVSVGNEKKKSRFIILMKIRRITVLKTLLFFALSAMKKHKRKGGFTRNLDAPFVTLSRDQWLKEVALRWDLANKKDVERQVGNNSRSKQLFKHAPTLVKSTRELQRGKRIKDNPNIIQLEEMDRQGASGPTMPIYLKNPTEFDNLINKGIENKGEPIDLNKTVKDYQESFKYYEQAEKLDPDEEAFIHKLRANVGIDIGINYYIKALETEKHNRAVSQAVVRELGEISEFLKELQDYYTKKPESEAEDT